MKHNKRLNLYKPIQLILVVGLYISIVQSGYSMDIQIKEATKQAWSGGFSYRHGISYTIGLTIFPSRYPVVLDSLWLEGNCRSLANYNYKGRSKQDTLSVYIMDGLNYDGKILIDPSWCKDPGKKGVVISYHQNNQRFLLDITPYLKELFPIAYP